MEDELVVYGQKFSSRLLFGTATYESPQQLTDAIRAAKSAVRRRGLSRRDLILEIIGIEAVESAFARFRLRVHEEADWRALRLG